MLHHDTLTEIRTNTNTGVEYEIAMFYKLLSNNPTEQQEVMEALSSRADAIKIKKIISYTNTAKVLTEVNRRSLKLADVSFETQNDEVGPADVVLYCTDSTNASKVIGLSIKYSNTCTLNVTGRKFITGVQIAQLKNKYESIYLPEYKADMAKRYGDASNWHRKTSTVTDKMIDEIRDAVINNWPNVQDKTTLLKNLFHDDSPIEFWVINYGGSNYTIKTKPSTIDMSQADEVVVRKYQTSYVTFHLGDERVGHMQVKFNNGFIEYNTRHDGSKKKKTPDFIRDGIEFIFGQPFGSWNFSVED